MTYTSITKYIRLIKRVKFCKIKAKAQNLKNKIKIKAQKLKTNSQNLKNKIKTKYQKLKTTYQNLKNGIETKYQKLKTSYQNLKNGIKTKYQKLKTTYQNIENRIKDAYYNGFRGTFADHSEAIIENTFKKYGVEELRFKFHKKHRNRIERTIKTLRLLSEILDENLVGQDTGIASLISDYLLYRFFVTKVTRGLRAIYRRSNFFGFFGFVEIFYAAGKIETFYRNREKNWKDIKLYMRTEVAYDPLNMNKFDPADEIDEEYEKFTDEEIEKWLATKTMWFSPEWFFFRYLNYTWKRSKEKAKKLKLKELKDSELKKLENAELEENK